MPMERFFKYYICENAYKMGCTYVSSLTDITNIQTVKLRRVLHHIAHSKTFA